MVNWTCSLFIWVCDPGVIARPDCNVGRAPLLSNLYLDRGAQYWWSGRVRNAAKSPATTLRAWCVNVIFVNKSRNNQQFKTHPTDDILEGQDLPSYLQLVSFGHDNKRGVHNNVLVAGQAQGIGVVLPLMFLQFSWSKTTNKDGITNYRRDGNRVANNGKCCLIGRGGSNKYIPWGTTYYDDLLPTYGLFIVSLSDLCKKRVNQYTCSPLSGTARVQSPSLLTIYI